jgi:hypothetical protein
MNTITLLSNPYIILSILIAIMVVACMVYVHVSDKKNMAFKKEHMYFDAETAKWYFKDNVIK